MTEVRLYHPVKRSGPSYSIGARLRRSGIEDVPGPGQYDYETPRKDPNIQGSFTSSKRYKQNGFDSPGPGAYDSYGIGASPSFSMRQKPRASLGFNSPGPGAYENGSKIMAGSSFASGKRFRMHPSENVGPGAYDPHDSKGGGASFGRARIRAKTDLSPGPGEYEPHTSFDGPSAKMGSKYRTREINQTPGPGSYSYNNSTFKRVGKTINRGPFKPPKLSYEDSPGPGSYNISPHEQSLADARNSSMGPGELAERIHQRGPQVSFARSKRNRGDSEREAIPGPGSYGGYDPNAGPGYSMGKSKRANLTGREAIPGPGTYAKWSDSPSTEGVKFTTSKRGSHAQDFIPGPGQYTESIINPLADSQRTIGIGQAKRLGLSDRKDVPGPGSYDINVAARDPVRQQSFTKSRRMPKEQLTNDADYYNIPAAIPIAPRYYLDEKDSRRT